MAGCFTGYPIPPAVDAFIRKGMSPRVDYKYAFTKEKVNDLFMRSLIKRAPFFIKGGIYFRRLQ